MEDDDAAFNDNALASKKKRKLLPADIEDNAGKKVRAELVVTRRSSDPSLEQKHADESFGMVVTMHDRKRQKYKVMQHRRRYVLEELNLPRSIDYWTVEDVADWTGYIGFPNYKETFFKNNINGEVLNSLTKERLKGYEYTCHWGSDTDTKCKGRFERQPQYKRCWGKPGCTVSTISVG